jgi:acyl carrier protein
MTNRNELEEKIIALLVELFELERGTISLDSQLYDDLDIDSIDAVDLVVELKKMTGKKVKPDDFKNVRTVGDIINAAEKLINS